MTSWNTKLYDNKHQFVSKYGESLVGLLEPQQGEHILDLGCGTGDLAQQIAQTGATVHGIDNAASMIEQAQVKYPHIQFDVADATKLPFNEQFDAVFTNAALHWIKTPELVITSMYNSLKTGGRLVGEMGGYGNVQSIVDAIKQAMDKLQLEYKEQQFPWYFPTEQQYSVLLEQAGFTIRSIERYERPTPLVGEDGMHNWIMMFSNSIFSHLTDAQKEAVYDLTETILRKTNYTDGVWIADYWRLRFVAHR